MALGQPFSVPEKPAEYATVMKQSMPLATFLAQIENPEATLARLIFDEKYDREVSENVALID